MNTSILSQLNNSYILITGATGLIGRAIVKMLINYNQSNPGTIQIVATGRNINKLREHFPNEYAYLHLKELNVNNEIELDMNVDYIIHTASITSSRDFVEKPVNVITTLLTGTENVLKFAKKRR